MLIAISYPLGTRTPLYPGTPMITIVPDKSMDRGDSANTSMLSFSSHAGTHVDVPRHFCRNGKSVPEIFRLVNEYFPAYCIDLPVTADNGIMADDLKERIADKADAEALLIRTGAWAIRVTDPHAYAATHPYIHAGVAPLLRSTCPRLRILGIDTISISTPSHRPEGKESHRAFLCDERPICLLEDADLSVVTPDDPFTLTLIPWLMDDLDGVPVTAFLVNNSRRSRG
jgi:arylformamidase